MNKSLRLLLIEDAARDARVIQELLQDVAPLRIPSITHVTTLNAALTALAQAPFDCVLLDFKLPDGEGVESVDRIRQLRRDVTIIVLTGNNDQQYALTALRRGAQEYAIKGQHDGTGLLLLIRHAVERQSVLTELELQRQRDYHRASHDALTNLPNRQLFQDRVRIAISQAPRSSNQPVLCFLDLDGFKQVNDRFGHATGDLLLRAVGDLLSRTVRDGDTVARLGGDEFAVLLTHASDLQDAATIANRMVERISALREIDGQAISIGVSIGLAVFPLHGKTCEQLIDCADRAMYRAKAAGKCQWRFFDAAPDVALARHGSGLDTRNLRLYFQPWYAADRSRCMGMEALVRLEGDADAGPALMQARQSQSLSLLGGWVLVQACRSWRELGPARQKGLRLAINVTPLEVEHRDYVVTTLALLQQFDIAPQTLQLEIAEDDLAHTAESGALIENLRALRQRGVHIAMDRFGRNQASLAQLASLPVNVVKIDMRHVRELRQHPQAQVFLAAVSGYAAALNCEVILCGIESEADLENLKSLPPNLLQGFGLAPPMTGPQLQSHLTTC